MGPGWRGPGLRVEDWPAEVHQGPGRQPAPGRLQSLCGWGLGSDGPSTASGPRSLWGWGGQPPPFPCVPQTRKLRHRVKARCQGPSGGGAPEPELGTLRRAARAGFWWGGPGQDRHSRCSQGAGVQLSPAGVQKRRLRALTWGSCSPGWGPGVQTFPAHRYGARCLPGAGCSACGP